MEMPMKLSERLNRDKEMLKTLEGNSKYLFIWDYYKIPILTALCLLVVLVSRTYNHSFSVTIQATLP